MRRCLVAVFSLSLGAVPLSLEAQTTLTIDVFGAGYVPAADLFDAVFPGLGVLSFKQKTAFAAGGRVAVWPLRRLGIEAEGAYAFSDVDFTAVFPVLDRPGGQATLPANMFFASLNLLYTIIDPPLDPVAVFLSGGVGVVARGGDFFRNFEDTADIAGVLGLGLRYGVAKGVRLRLDVRDYISSYEEKALTEELRVGGFDVGASLQQDILIAGAVEFVLGGS